jgi:protein involved in polysaccharide export with SLBB domain
MAQWYRTQRAPWIRRHTAIGIGAAILTVTSLNGRTAADEQPRQLERPRAGTPSAIPSTAVVPKTAATSDSYRLEPGDTLRLRFFDRYDREDLNGDYMIGESGMMELPRLGKFAVRNKTTGEVEQDIRSVVDGLGEKLGNVSIVVAATRPFYVVGYVNQPGAYAYTTGLTVLHALALAGGYYRPQVGSSDALHERGRLVDASEQLKTLLARRARLIAERDEVATVAVPSELTEMDPLQAKERIQLENVLVQNQLRETERKRVGLERTIATTRDEVASYQTEITSIDQRIQEQTKLFTQITKLKDQRLINEARYFEAVSAMNSAYRDQRFAIAGLSRAKGDLEKANRDHAMLKLANSTRLAKEIADVEADTARLRAVVDQLRHSIAKLDGMNGSIEGPSIGFRILRNGPTGSPSFFEAAQTTVIRPGDVVEIERQTQRPMAKLN